MITEFGSIQNIRFPSVVSLGMYDAAGNVMHCKCGKAASSGVIGKEAFKVWCKDCCPNKGCEAVFIYKEPNHDDPKYKKALEICEDKKG